MIDPKVMSRSFSYDGVKLPDPDPRMTPEEVKTIYSNQYPELATAAIMGPEASEERLQYSFVRAMGRRGSPRHGAQDEHLDVRRKQAAVSANAFEAVTAA